MVCAGEFTNFSQQSFHIIDSRKSAFMRDLSQTLNTAYEAASSKSNILGWGWMTISRKRRLNCSSGAVSCSTVPRVSLCSEPHGEPHCVPPAAMSHEGCNGVRSRITVSPQCFLDYCVNMQEFMDHIRSLPQSPNIRHLSLHKPVNSAFKSRVIS